jgi:TolB protein
MWRLVVAMFLVGCSKKPAAPPPAPPPPAVVQGVVDAGVAVVVKTVAPPAQLVDAGFRLAWISEASGLPQVVVDGRPLTAPPAAHYLAGALADGVFVSRSENEHEQLLFVGFDGGLGVLSEASARARGVSSAAGVTLFESGVGGLSNLERVDGGQLVTDPAGSFEPSVAPGGKWFAFVSSRDGDAEIYRASIDGGQVQRLTAFHLDDVAPKVSPDGKWIAFVSNREGQDRLFLVKPDGRGQRRLHDTQTQDMRWDAGEFEAGEADAVWTPNSRELVFSSRGPRGYWHLYAASVAGGELTQLTDGAWDDQLPALSPDGKWIAFVSNRDGNAEIYVMKRSETPSRVTFDPSSDWKPMWIPAR